MKLANTNKVVINNYKPNRGKVDNIAALLKFIGPIIAIKRLGKKKSTKSRDKSQGTGVLGMPERASSIFTAVKAQHGAAVLKRDTKPSEFLRLRYALFQTGPCVEN